MRIRLAAYVLAAYTAILHGCASSERSDLDIVRHRVTRVAGPPGTASGAGTILRDDRLLISNHVLARLRGSPWILVEGVPLDYSLVEAGREPDEFLTVDSGPSDRLCDLAPGTGPSWTSRAGRSSFATSSRSDTGTRRYTTKS
ncbi:MAG: hypothetical protein KF787_05975 [Phycisphaeraceae bacterium]|nr:hypothetical protein [Phycisphaerae bacterium]MBX3392178.1 hypothetical protein [Phycisphaeraceae bacterium]